MGIKLRLKQELRRGMQQCHARWHRSLAPFCLPRERKKLAAIHALGRVQESKLPVDLKHIFESFW